MFNCFRVLPGIAPLLIAIVATRLGFAYTPDSPEVNASVDRAVQFIEATAADRWGAEALVGLALIKANREASHPRVQQAVNGCIAAAQGKLPSDVYSLGIGAMFLAELDGERYAPVIEALAKRLLAVQKGHGGFGYPDKPTGDTSMTQYGTLGLWAADSVGVATPDEAWERCLNWLLRTQDPSGMWGYQGIDPGSFALRKQNETRASLTAAGLCSVYIAADHLAHSPRVKRDDNLPSALKLVKARTQARAPSENVDAEILKSAKDRAEDWLRGNAPINPPEWPYYYLYALERFHSFRELATGDDLTAGWYQDGVRFLLESQRKDGAWSGRENYTLADTCFGILFMKRSTKSAIRRAEMFGAGVLVGGRGLPNEEELRLRRGRLEVKPLAGPAEQLLSIVEDPSSPEYLRALEALEEMTEQGRAEELSEQAQRLRKLAGGDSPDARAAALSALAQTRNLDDVPLFLEALRDPDPVVYRAALGGLQFMSRKLARPAEIAPIDDKSREAAFREWTEWYGTIRPDARIDLP